MLCDPGLCLAIVGAKLFDQSPKPLGMVVLADVRQLMQDDIIPDGVRHLNQPPVERDGVSTGT